MRAALRVHFFHITVRDTVVILEQGNLPHPRCPHCDTLVPRKDLNGHHTTTTQYAKGEERKRRWLAGDEMRDSAMRDFQAYGRPTAGLRQAYGRPTAGLRQAYGRPL